MNDVRLSWSELRRAGHVGIDRYVRVLAARHSTDAYVPDHPEWEAHVLGAWGECVVAKVTDCYWIGDLGRPDGGAGDVGSMHVRTAARSDRKLILHDDDVDDEPFILVVPLRLPQFRIVGWCYGREGKLPVYWETFTGRPAYFVPQDVLRPLSELRALA